MTYCSVLTMKSFRPELTRGYTRQGLVLIAFLVIQGQYCNQSLLFNSLNKGLGGYLYHQEFVGLYLGRPTGSRGQSKCYNKIPEKKLTFLSLFFITIKARLMKGDGTFVLFMSECEDATESQETLGGRH